MMFAGETEGMGIPRVAVGDWIETGFNWARSNLGEVFALMRNGLETLTEDWLETLLTWPDALVLSVIFALLAWMVRDWKLGVLTLVLMVSIIAMDQWDNAMATLALVLVATGVALVIAIPVGVLAAKSDRVSSAVRPIMDLMQTMPALVWLVPVVTLFSIGVPAGVVATLIFCLPPGVRFTELGIRQVDREVVEAGHAFGSTPGQILFRIQLPLAVKTIMAGVNQVIMLALSMAVIAGFVGAGGLGGEVARAIGSLDIALGFEAGLSVVVLAIYLDRVTAAVGDGSGILTKLLRRRRPAPEQVSATEPAGTDVPTVKNA
ncbi:ABC transporter permease [Nesterenkonia sphaerica]|uniref:ABC transporter permease subunit n=1 Tax=Nesterenkonia sphaerica TaxID=1804988 RepID=A0A5R9ABU3_9MICC|nr:ABC transporter permease subunit [Nesterenkonia sphaerica]TLP75604.1 ABC transporter permease subunit [Nesterenkonia sphaerica]